MSDRHSALLLFGVIGIMAAPALAQTTPRSIAAVPPVPATAAPAPATTPPEVPMQYAPASPAAKSLASVAVVPQRRISQVIGQSVYNDQHQKIGRIDDILLGTKGAPSAVVSVGGFLGIGAKLIDVPLDQLNLSGNEVVMPGATKAQLNLMASYSYNS